MARNDIGIDFDGTDFRFVESTGFLLAVLALTVLAYSLERVRAARAPDDPRPAEPDPAGRPGGRSPVEAGLLVLALAFGALLFAGSLADEGHTAWPGLIAGAACALLGYVAVAALFARARRRLEDPTMLEIWSDLISLVLAGLAVLAPPLGFVALLGFLFLLLRAGSQADKKYEGLRILR